MKLPKSIKPKASPIDKSLLEEVLFKEAKDNGFNTREEYVKWKLNKDLSNIQLNYIDIDYDSKQK
ncbi:MAG: hypothetical protein WDA02_03320 [Saccharofermentanales bacterium]